MLGRLPLSDTLIKRWEILFFPSLAIGALAMIPLSFLVGAIASFGTIAIGMLALMAGSAVARRASQPECETSAQEPPCPHTAAVIVDFERLSASFFIFNMCNLLSWYFLESQPADYRGVNRILTGIGILGGLAVTIAIGYLRREFFDILPDRIVHRKYPLIGEPEIKTIRYEFAAICREKNTLRITQSSALEILVPLVRLDRPLRFLAAIEATSGTSLTRHAEDARAAPAAERET